MITPYRELFSISGTKSFSLAGLLARLSLPMTGIGIIIMLSQIHGSYALAGAVSATFVMTYALLSPQISRLVDHYGQSKILPISTFISSIGFLLLIFFSWKQTPNWTLFTAAFLTGFMPSISAIIRARWIMIYSEKSQLQTAFSLETVFDEVTFILGPPLAISLSITFFPQASLLIAMLFLILGVFVLIMQRSTEPKIEKENLVLAQKHDRSVILLPTIRLLTILMIAMGIIVGTVDIVSVAFAKNLGQPAAASIVLSAYAIGSCVAGLIFGTLKLQAPLHHLLLLSGLATAVSTLPLLWINNITMLTMSILIAGLFFAPTMIIAMSLVERLIPKHRLTEGMTWLLAGLNIGVALGAAISGQIVDAHGMELGFVVALCAGAVVLLVAFWTNYRLRTFSYH